MFHNIFSNKKVKNDKQIKLLVDHREKNSLVSSYLIEKGFAVEFHQMPVADYIIGETIIERKTISDLKSSIINKRIISQLLELKQHRKSILLVEGINDEDIYKGIIHENAFRGFLLSVALEYKVPIIFTKNAEDTAKYIETIAKKREKKSQPSLRQSIIQFSDEEQAQFILEGFPNIGPVTAKKLIEKFHSLNNIFNASEDDLKEILGKRTSNFKEILIKNIL